MVKLLILLTNVTESQKIQTKMIICWCFSMLKMEIYINIYQKVSQRLLGKIKLNHLIGFHLGKFEIIIVIIVIKC